MQTIYDKIKLDSEFEPLFEKYLLMSDKESIKKTIKSLIKSTF